MADAATDDTRPARGSGITNQTVVSLSLVVVLVSAAMYVGRKMERVDVMNEQLQQLRLDVGALRHALERTSNITPIGR
ncbi:MAG: hypothetical protein V4617_15075 [Gemmatimonadota bacterium]